MLKHKINKADFDKLHDVLKAEYKQAGDDYVLDAEDTSLELKRAKDREKQRAKEAEEKVTALTAENEALKKASNNGDLTTLEKSWTEKHNKVVNEKDATISKQRGVIESMLVDDAAMKLATEISTSPALLKPHIKARLKADFDGEEPTTKILDASGNISALSIDDLKKEIIDNPDYSAIIIGSKASGSSTATVVPARSSESQQPVNLAKMSPVELGKRLEAAKNQK